MSGEKSVLNLRRFVAHVAADGALMLCDGLEWEGKLWLVPSWDDFGDGYTRPSHMIRFDHLPHQLGVQGADYLVNGLLPPGLLGGAPASGYEILAGDEIPFVVPVAAGPLH